MKQLYSSHVYAQVTKFQFDIVCTRGSVPTSTVDVLSTYTQEIATPSVNSIGVPIIYFLEMVTFLVNMIDVHTMCTHEIVVLRWVYTFDAVKRFDTLSYASQMRIKAFCGVSVYTFHAGISARQRARESVARREMLQSSTVLNFHALRQRTQAIHPIIYRCHELSL